MSTVSIASTAPEDRVRDIAFSLWLEEGRPDGRAEAHWFKALELVNAEGGAPAVKEPDKAKRKTPAAAAKKAAPRKRG
jgi:hypothetical protein